MSNPHFNFYSNNQEWKLYNDMANESINSFGIPVKYMLRKTRKDDKLFGESTGTYFTEENSFDLTMYMEDSLSFGEDEVYSKFGLRFNNRVNLFIQQDTIINTIGEVPFFGDLIYIPMFNRLFEVIEPEEKASFFLFGRLMTYLLKCELMKYNQESMNVGIDEVDNLNGETAPDNTLNDNMDDDDDEVTRVINFDESKPFG